MFWRSSIMFKKYDMRSVRTYYACKLTLSFQNPFLICFFTYGGINLGKAGVDASIIATNISVVALVVPLTAFCST